jgi:long-subunit fatty acid transport protein
MNVNLILTETHLEEKMKIFKKYKTLIIISVLIFILPLNGSDLKKIGQSGMKWLSIPLGARAASMGNSYTAVANDAGSVFWNPAGLVFATGTHVYLNQTQWIADIKVNVGVLSYNAGTYGTFGLSMALVDWGTFHGTRRTNTAQGYEETGDFSPENWAVGLTYARKISNSFAIGGNIRYLNEDLGSTMEGTFDDPKEYNAKMNLLAFDLGTIYHTGFKDLRLAMTLQNFSKESKYRYEDFSLPLTFKIGLAMNLLDLVEEESSHLLTLSVDAVHPRDYTERLHFGLEYGFKEMFFLRGGFKTNYDEENFSAGAGFAYPIGNFKLALDYSYVNFENFDAVHMFSFDFSL